MKTYRREKLIKNFSTELRKEANESFSAHRLHVMKNPNNSVNLGLFSSSPADKEKSLQEAEKVSRIDDFRERNV